jgi:hypothetical protein
MEKDVCKINSHLVSEFIEYDEGVKQAELDALNARMAKVYSYEEEVKKSLFFLTGCIDCKSEAYQDFAPVGYYERENPKSRIRLTSLLVSMHLLRAKKLGVEFETNPYKGYYFYNNKEDVDDIMWLRRKAISYEGKAFIGHIVNPIAKELLGRTYHIEYGYGGLTDDGDWYLVPDDETYKEYMVRKHSYLLSDWYKSSLISMIPLIGQVVWVYLLIETIWWYFKNK